MATTTENFLGIVDFLVIGATLLFSLCIGVFYAIKGRNQGNNEELLMGGHKMGAIPVAASMLVSYLSAITILGKVTDLGSIFGEKVDLVRKNCVLRCKSN